MCISVCEVSLPQIIRHDLTLAFSVIQVEKSRCE